MSASSSADASGRVAARASARLTAVGRLADAALARGDGDDALARREPAARRLRRLRRAGCGCPERAGWAAAGAPPRRRALGGQHGGARTGRPDSASTAVSAARAAARARAPRAGSTSSAKPTWPPLTTMPETMPSVDHVAPRRGCGTGERVQHRLGRHLGHGPSRRSGSLMLLIPSCRGRYRQAASLHARAGGAPRQRPAGTAALPTVERIRHAVESAGRRALGRRRPGPGAAVRAAAAAAAARSRGAAAPEPGRVESLLPGGGAGGSRRRLACIAVIGRRALARLRLLPGAARRAGRGAALRQVRPHDQPGLNYHLPCADRGGVHAEGHPRQPRRDRLPLRRRRRQRHARATSPKRA